MEIGVETQDKNQNNQEKRRVVLEAKTLQKHYGRIRAVDEVSFQLYEKEILGIVGDNGAGKSTLIKLISGVVAKDGGEVLLDGRHIEVNSTSEARKLGIETVYQTSGLVEVLNAPSNLFLGREKIKSQGWGRFLRTLDKNDMKKETVSLLNKLQINLKNINAPVKVLSGGQQQSVVVGRAAYWKGKIIILDEPANNLGVEEQRKVLGLVKQIREQHNVSFIMISHNLEHVFGVADRIIVMRNGKICGTRCTEQTTRNEIVCLITGATE